jgi:hypothetical protein
MREQQVLPDSKPATPSVMKRSCQRQTSGFARAGATHDLGRAATVCRQQHDLRPPDMLPRAVSVRYRSLQIDAIRGAHFNFDATARPTDTHAGNPVGILIRTQPLDLIHQAEKNGDKKISLAHMPRLGV